MTLYQTLHELQLLLATWAGACPTCHQPVKPLPHNNTDRPNKALLGAC